MWYAKQLVSPPIVSLKTDMGAVDADKLKRVFETSIQILDDKRLIHKEAALLSRIIYKGKHRFRGDKGFKYMEKVYRGLRQYMTLDLKDIYNFFVAGFELTSDGLLFLPSRQMLECVLVRTQGFAKLMHYIAVACQEAVVLSRAVLKRGHLVASQTMALALLSRIWQLGRYLLVCACEWYSQLLPFRPALLSASQPWLPAGYELPADLWLWLGPGLLTDGLALPGGSSSKSQPVSSLASDLGELVARDAQRPVRGWGAAARQLKQRSVPPALPPPHELTPPPSPPANAGSSGSLAQPKPPASTCNTKPQPTTRLSKSLRKPPAPNSLSSKPVASTNVSKFLASTNVSKSLASTNVSKSLPKPPALINPSKPQASARNPKLQPSVHPASKLPRLPRLHRLLSTLRTPHQLRQFVLREKRAGGRGLPGSLSHPSGDWQRLLASLTLLLKTLPVRTSELNRSSGPVVRAARKAIRTVLTRR